ncbi:hypothetical protein OHS18_20320 [Amycolatopsis sp. NBC_00355]|uniref:hypothetical protein n=1 Tax=Amycolatopsis sp. NBC_00355 TaxID=2975957 RepID=UPI002E25AB61
MQLSAAEPASSRRSRPRQGSTVLIVVTFHQHELLLSDTSGDGAVTSTGLEPNIFDRVYAVPAASIVRKEGLLTCSETFLERCDIPDRARTWRIAARYQKINCAVGRHMMALRAASGSPGDLDQVDCLDCPVFTGLSGQRRGRRSWIHVPLR